MLKNKKTKQKNNMLILIKLIKLLINNKNFNYFIKN